MAKEKPNKSALIREALRAHKGKSPAEIATLLNEKHGLDLTGQYVSNVKSNTRRARKIVRKVRRIVRRAKRGNEAGNGLTAVNAAVEFVKVAGGIEQAKAALATVEEIGRAVQ